MTDTQHTPGPWSHCTTLPTRKTLRWSHEEIALIDVRERRMVFSRFPHPDEGRGRLRVAVCDRAEDAQLIAAAPKMKDALRSILNMALLDSDSSPWSRTIIAECREALDVVDKEA